MLLYIGLRSYRGFFVGHFLWGSGAGCHPIGMTEFILAIVDKSFCAECPSQPTGGIYSLSACVVVIAIYGHIVLTKQRTARWYSICIIPNLWCLC